MNVEAGMLKKKLLVIFSLVVLLSLAYSRPAGAAKTYSAERFDVQIEVQPGGLLLVTETITFRFEGGPFTYVFRELDFANLDDIEIQSASLDGQVLPEGYDAGQAQIDGGRPLRVTWHFSPISDSTHTYVLVYKVAGAIRKLESDTLIWRAIPQEHEYPVKKSEITLTYPSSVSLIEPPSLNRPFAIQRHTNGVRLMTSDLGNNDDVIITAHFPAGSLISAAPDWQLRQITEKESLLGALPIGFLSFILSLALGWFGLRLYKNNNHRESVPEPAVPYTALPQDLPPALVGKMLGLVSTVQGTLFDFARRDILEIQENPGKRRTSILSFVRKPTDVSLRPHEQILLDGLFTKSATIVDLAEIGKRILQTSQKFDQSLESELSQMNWFDPARKKQRTILMAFWATLLFLAIASSCTIPIVALYLAGKEPIVYTIASICIGVCGGISIVSIAGLYYAVNFSVLTPAGDEQTTRWKSFKGYLQKVGQGIEPIRDSDLFDRYLPFAAVFGFGEGWVKNCEKMGYSALPAWIHSLTSDSGFTALYSVMSTLDTSSSSGSGDGGGSSGGASGGGSSGAG